MRSTQTGLCLVNTGDGKGKTTASLGLLIRAVGQGLRVLMIQFIKSPDRTYGERNILEQIGVEMIQTGVGFTWTKTPEEHRAALQAGWTLAKEKVYSGQYDLIILDELNNALAIERFPIDDVLPLAEVLDVIRTRPKHLHLVITGRNAHPSIIEIADLVTEMKAVKHYYEDGIPAVRGIEF